MPNLRNFLRGNGSLLSNEHTPLIAHTANDIVNSETGLYPDRQALNVANSYGCFNTGGSISFPSAFTSWTDPVQTSATPNPPPNLVTPQGKNVPAPWVPYTRAGCNFGAVASGNTSLKNTRPTPARRCCSRRRSQPRSSPADSRAAGLEGPAPILVER
ncbi:MAG: hypothetical protein ACR2OB_10625 [Solirubrobacteraceae bacterium]